MKTPYPTILFSLLGMQTLLGQELATNIDLENQLLFGPVLSVQADSLSPPPKRRLLPENISFAEKGLWGEDGFFRTAGLASPLTPEVRKSELGLRRTMLSVHQVGGFVTLGLMGTAAYFGQKLIDGDRGYRTNHQIFVTATIVSYSGTALLAILSPPPVIRRDEVSTTTIHKTLAWVHAAGMILTPILGASLGRSSSSQEARFHQVAAYFTTATLAASLITITF